MRMVICVAAVIVAGMLISIPLSNSSGFTEGDARYVSTVRFYLAEFGQEMNDLNGYIAKAMGNPGILKVDEGFRKGFRDAVMSNWELLTKISELKPGKVTTDAHKILVNAAGLYQTYFTVILSSLDNWTPDMTSKLSRLSNDANVTFNTYLTRIPK